MLTLTPTLLAHQQGPRRRPSVTCYVASQRSLVAVLAWERWYTGAEPDSPHAATVTTTALIRARNEAGSLKVSRVAAPSSSSTFSSWTNLAAVTAGSRVALASRTGEILLFAGDNTAAKVWTSSDDGVTWSAPTTIVTEASAIGAVAAAYAQPSGEPCLFYILGTTTALKRLRRTAGVWAGSGTNWSRSASVAALTGLSAAWDSDFRLVVTGTEVTTTHKRAWAVSMGDTDLPANFWSGLTNIAEADALSTVTFAAPAIAADGFTPHATFAQAEAGNVPETRVMYSHGALGSMAGWVEPAPTEATNANGFALALRWQGQDVYAATPSGVWHAAISQGVTLTTRLLAARWKITPTSARGAITIDASDTAQDAQLADATGWTVNLQHGYESGPAGATETGLVLSFTVERVTITRERGHRVATLDLIGPWEHFARYRQPQAWQVATGVATRSATFARLALRAGVEVASGSGSRAPSAAWTADTPAFAVAAGETGASVLARLFATVPDMLQLTHSALRVVSFSETTPAYSYGDGSHPLTAVEIVDEPQDPNWVRVQGPDRYADAVTPGQVARHGPRLQLLRQQDATSNARATAAAAAALRRAVMLRPALKVTAAANVGLELFDVVDVDGAAARVISIETIYERGPKGPRFDQVLTLGGL